MKLTEKLEQFDPCNLCTETKYLPDADGNCRCEVKDDFNDLMSELGWIDNIVYAAKQYCNIYRDFRYMGGEYRDNR